MQIFAPLADAQNLRIFISREIAYGYACLCTSMQLVKFQNFLQKIENAINFEVE